MESAKNFNLMRALKENGIYVVLLVLLMIIVIKEPSFLSLTNFSNILTQSSVRVIIALGWLASSSPRGRICRPVVRSAWQRSSRRPCCRR